MQKNRLDLIYQDAAEVLEKVDFSWLEGKTVLLTGATGLLGTHFLATLALLNERGAKMKVFGVCHSDPESYTNEIAKRGGLYLLDDNQSFSFKADATIHSAGYAQPSKFTCNQAETIRINTETTRHLLNALNPGGKFLFVSSSEVYSGLSGTVDETRVGTATPSHPRAGYIYGKLCGEAIVNAYRQMGVEAKSARLCLTYGPGTRPDDDRAMSQFIQLALSSGGLNLKYSGQEVRSFCYVEDAIEIMWNILLHGKQSVYNVAGLSTYSMAEVATQIAILTDVGITFPKDNVEMLGSHPICMNTERVEKEFNKRLYLSLRYGLKRTIDWNRGFYEPI
jgi:UDP-glucuronate decarboxylase